MKDCGECSLCCKLMNVPGMSGAGELCQHCKPERPEGCCTIHGNMPKACRGFDCFWRAESWPDWLRPDRSKVIFEALPGVMTILVSVDSSSPQAWKKKKVLDVIRKLRTKGRPLVLKTKTDSAMFIPKGWTKHDVMRDIEKVLAWKKRMDNGGTHVHH